MQRDGSHIIMSSCSQPCCGLTGHDKAVATLDVDAAGARVLSGSRDYNLHIYDFNGMKSDMRAFRTVLPFEGHPVLGLSWSPTGEQQLLYTSRMPMAAYLIMSCHCSAPLQD